MTSPVHISEHAGAVLIEIDHPPVNALSASVRTALADTLARLAAAPGVTSAVLACRGASFVAGADITEFDAPPVMPLTGDLCAALEASPFPVVAAIHGTALGGGFELALACHGRVIARDAQVGLPEVRLGLIPGGGGTQRLPRLIGPVAALEMIASGRMVPAAEAASLGLVDAVATDVLKGARTLALALAGARRWRKLGSQNPAPSDPAAWDDARRRWTQRARGQAAPVAAVAAVGWSVMVPFCEGLARERRASLAMRVSPQSRALRALFRAERQATKVPHVASGVRRSRDIADAGVVGGGLMGTGIAVALAAAGVRVTLVEVSQPAAQAASERVQRLTHRPGARSHADIDVVSDLVALRSKDLVIEAVTEDLSVKLRVLAEAASIVSTDTLIATNTSYLPLESLASAVSVPERFLGLHFFSPAHVMRLVEVVRGPQTDATAISKGIALARRLGKHPVVCRSSEGFIGNRLLMRWRLPCDYALEEGARPEDVDAALEGYGFAMGPFAVADLAGLDIGYATRRRLREAGVRLPRHAPLADWLCEDGRLGQKTGRGWYKYDEARKHTDPEIDAYLARASEARGITRAPINPESLVARVLAVIANEASALLQEQVAMRPSDIDVVLVHGYGFPTWRGGPLHAVDQFGLPPFLSLMEELAARPDWGWEVAPLFRHLAERNRTFHSLASEDVPRG